MRSAIILIIFCCSLLCLQARTWTDQQGRSFEGQMIDGDIDTVRIRRDADQQTFDLALDRLSKEDQKYVYQQLKIRPIKENNYSSTFATTGAVEGYWRDEGDRITIVVDEWEVRFKCKDEKGRELDELYFSIAKKTEKGWTKAVESNRHRVGKFIREGKPLKLEDLEFTIELDELDRQGVNREDAWIVAVYQNERGRCYDHFDYHRLAPKTTVAKAPPAATDLPAPPGG